MKSELQVGMFDREMICSGVTSPESANFRFDKMMIQVKCDEKKMTECDSATVKCRRRSRGERSINKSSRAKTPITAPKKIMNEPIEIVDQHSLSTIQSHVKIAESQPLQTI